MMLGLNPLTLCKIKYSPYGSKREDYYSGEVLGKGGFSTVYRAKCLKTGKDVAIKQIKKEVIVKQDLLERVSQEINIQAELSHPSILKLYTAFEDLDHIYIVLELCSNGELRKYKSIYSEKEVKEILKQIIDGLTYLHSKGILHRDIKLSNVLLDENMHVKIADFGLATIMDPDKRHMTMCGTPNYISPEVLSRKTHGLEVDLWSLGVLLYTLLVGQEPFGSDTVKSTLNRVITGHYYMPEHLSQPARDLISGLLQKEPSNRMNLSEVLRHPFLAEEEIISNKWISSDSGCESRTASTNISSKFHSLDRKQHSNNSEGYYSYETPKLPRRSRSHDRNLWESRDEIGPACVDNFNNRLMNQAHTYDKNSRNSSHKDIISERPIEHYKSNDPYSNKYSNNSSTNPSCQIFCENEVNRQNCHCFECKYKTDEQFLRDNFKTTNSHQYPANDYCASEKTPSQCNCGKRMCEKGNSFESKPKEHQTTARTTAEPVYTTDTVKVVPFNTERLKPTRHRSKNVILSILENGDVCVEFLRNKSKVKEMVVEVCRISKNGMKMSVYYPNKGRGIPPSDTPPPMPINGADAVFNCETLSKDNWKKYTYAARFVEMVQTKTPKITLYTEKAKCVLMENKPDPDFEVIYYEGAKITKSRKGIKLTDNNGLISVLTDTGQDGNMNSREKEHYFYFKQCYEHCRLIEEKLSSTCFTSSETFFKVFPAILGKKPVIKEKDSIWDGCTESPNLFHSTKYTT